MGDPPKSLGSSRISQMSQDSLATPIPSNAPAPGMPIDELPPRDDDVDLVALAAQKRRELFELDELRIRAMEKQVQEKDDELNKVTKTMAHLREDFEFNLALIGERDDELSSFERQVEELTSQLHQRDQTISRVQSAHADALGRCEALEDQLRLAQVQYQERLARAEETFAALRKSLEHTHEQTHEDLKYQVKTLQHELAAVKEQNELNNAQKESRTQAQLDALKAQHHKEENEWRRELNEAVAFGESATAKLNVMQDEHAATLLKVTQLERVQEELRDELKLNEDKLKILEEERERERKETEEHEKALVFEHDKALAQHEAKLSSLLTSLQKVEQQAQAAKHRHETHQQTLVAQHAQDLADKHSEWQAQLSAAEANAGMHIQRADRLEKQIREDAAKTQTRIQTLQREVDGLREAVLVATASSERIGLEAAEKSASEVCLYVCMYVCVYVCLPCLFVCPVCSLACLLA
jgi:hypothetical protein